MHDTQLLRLISERLDPDVLVDILGLSTNELAIVYMSEVMAKKDEFLNFLDFQEFDEGEEL
jgi:hypothetical protein